MLSSIGVFLLLGGCVATLVGMVWHKTVNLLRVFGWLSASNPDPHRRAIRAHHGSEVHLIEPDHPALILALKRRRAGAIFRPPGETEAGSAGEQPTKG
jgi:hypothetical protein